jgi:hypothetical protein
VVMVCSRRALRMRVCGGDGVQQKGAEDESMWW